jgi:hypothetical protein
VSCFVSVSCRSDSVAPDLFAEDARMAAMS